MNAYRRNASLSLYPNQARPSVRIRKVPQRVSEPQNDFLMHYGISGQKWGIRRFQNEDGTLTEEGKRRYQDRPESESWKKSEAEHLTDEELRRRNNRLQSEQLYKNLTTSEIERERKQFKKDLLKKALIIPIVGIAAVAGKKYIGKAANLITDYAKKKIAPYKAAGMLRKTLKNANVPGQTFNPFANLSKHVWKIDKKAPIRKMMSSPGRKIYEKGAYASPILKERLFWRGM